MRSVTCTACGYSLDQQRTPNTWRCGFSYVLCSVCVDKAIAAWLRGGTAPAGEAER